MILTRSELKRRSGNDPTPGGGDVRRLMAELCILPLSQSLFVYFVKYKFRVDIFNMINNHLKLIVLH